MTGPGADAAHGGFTGAAAAVVYRSGGRTFHGLAETLFRDSALSSANVSEEVLAANPALAAPRTDRAVETSAQVGGPLRRDQAWFFAGAQLRNASQVPAGYPASGARSPSEISPRLLFKPTWRRSARDTVTTFVTVERYGAQARDASARVAPEATLEERAATAAWDARFTRVVSPATLFEADYSGFRGADDRTPYNGETPGWYDLTADYYSVNAPYFFTARRARQQGRVRLSRLVGAAGGSHALAAGAELGQSSARSDYGYPGGRAIDAAAGVPRFVYLWEGALRESASRRLGAFVEDGWTIGSRLSLDPGVRIDWTTASNRHSGARIYDAVSIAPRMGLAWQATGSGRTIFRGQYRLVLRRPQPGPAGGCRPAHRRGLRGAGRSTAEAHRGPDAARTGYASPRCRGADRTAAQASRRRTRAPLRPTPDSRGLRPRSPDGPVRRR